MIRSLMSAMSCAALSVVAFAGCGSGGGGDANEAENLGSISLALQSEGVTLNSVTYTITGVGFTKVGIVDITNTTTIALLIGGLPVGSFDITLSAVDENDPSDTCSGSGSFDIAAHQTTSTLVNLYCKAPPKTGSVEISGTVKRCPTLAEVSAEPAQAFVGHTITLVAHTDYPSPNEYSSLYGYLWTVSSGKLSGYNNSTAILTCTKPGTVRVTVDVSANDGACDDSSAFTVECAPTSPIIPTEDDPNTPGDDNAGLTSCGNGSCGPTSGCCANGIGCAGGMEVCPGYYEACDGPEDCESPGERCFVENYSAKCELNATYSVVRCHTSADCVQGASSPNPCSASGRCLAYPDGAP